MLRTTIKAAVAACMLVTGIAGAETREFNFQDPKGVNAMTFTLDSRLEPIVGVASGVAGTVKFDPERPEQTSGKLRVAASSLHTPNPVMKEKLHSAEWLDVEKHPLITFAFYRVEKAKQVEENKFELALTGDFTCHGVTKQMTIPVTAVYLPGELKSRMHRGEGDLLVLRTTFPINRSDFNIKPDAPDAVVANEIQIRAGIVGAWSKPKPE